LDVVGDGPARVEYEALSQALGVDDRVHFHGDQPREHVAELMRAADLYLLTSEWENLPTVVLESLCTGLPVVASDVGGVAEAVGPDDGLLVERGNPGLFSIAIDTALRRAWDRAAIARRAAARFGLDRIRARWEDIYWRLITQRRRGARS
jgi:glycosyltransferase involved in cell wall biosynthesis